LDGMTMTNLPNWEPWNSEVDGFVGGHLLDYLPPIKYSTLVQIFGEPNSDGDGYKVDAEWELKVDGKYASIYNYKNGPNYTNEGSIEDIIDWHIGGVDDSVVPLVNQIVAGTPVTNPEPNVEPELQPLDLNGIAVGYHYLVRDTIERAKAKKFTYDKLKDLGLPIPKDLRNEVEGWD
jgi:hypothetical protein